MTRAVTDILYRTDGSPWASAPVTFERNAGSFDDGSSWPPDEKQATTDATGAYSVQLWPDAAGSIRSRYHVTYPNGDVFYVSIPDGTTPISMPEIRVAAVVPPVPPSALDAHVAAPDPHAGYLLATEADALYAPIVSPALTGTPTGPTAASGTNTTQLATTAFVQAAGGGGGGGGDWSSITGTPTTIAGYGITDAWTRTEADARYAPIVHSQAWSTITTTPTTLGGYGITDAYTKGQVDTALGGKANAATTLSGYGIDDAYTKTAADARYAPLSHTQAWITITGTPTTILGYGITDALSQASGDLRYAPIAHTQAWSTITGTPTTVAGYAIADVYTQTQSNASLALKANLAGGNSLTGAQTVTSDATGTKPLSVKAFSGQTASLQEWQDAAGAALLRVTSAGAIVGSSATLVQAGFFTDAANTICYLQSDSDPTHAFTFITRLAARVPLSVRGAISQSADLQQWQDSGQVVGSRINKAAYFITHKNAAPADADVATNGLAFWFDSTTGAAKVMFKGKNAAGTVVTGQVALA